MKKLILLPGFVLAILVGTSLFGVDKAYAAAGQVIDRSTIKVGSQVFFDGDIDDNFNYREQDPSDSCTDEIKGFDNDDLKGNNTPSEAKLRIGTPAGAGSSACNYREENVTFSDRANFQKAFVWVDTSTIAGSDGKLTFKRDGTTRTFISENDKNGCRDTITVASSNQALSLQERTGNTSTSRHDYDWYPFNPGERTWNETTECWESPVINGIKIAGTPDDGNDGAAPGLGGSSTASTEETENCENASKAEMSWLICPLLRQADNGVEWMDRTINNILLVPNAYLERGNPEHDRLEDTWQRMRNIAYLILVPIALIMVISTALGFEFVSAYTVKKALPRMGAAVIFIALSWEITKFLTIFSNNVGSGMMGLIMSGFGNGGEITFSSLFSPDGGDSTKVFSIALLGGAAASGLAIGALFFILSYALVAAAGLFLGFIVLTFRQMLIVALMLVGPLAILAWIFPGNDKLWKLWWGSFSKLLLLFPLIAVVIGSGKAFASVVADVNGGFVDTLIKLVAYIGPYFLIPSLFKFAGGAFATISGMANDRSRGFFDKRKKSRQERWGQSVGEYKSGARPARTSLGRFSNRIGVGMGVGYRGRYGFGEQGAQARDQISRQASIEQVMKSSAWNGISNNDDALHAATYASAKEAQDALTQRFGDSERARRAVAAVQTSVGFGRPQAIAAAQQLVSTGTGYSDLTDMATTMARASGGNASTMSSLAGFGNAETKKVGRHDLAPGFGNLDKLVRAQAGVAASADGKPIPRVGTAEYEEFHDKTQEEAWKAGSLYAVANGKPAQTEAFGKYWAGKHAKALRTGDTETLLKAEVARKELKAMLPNATGGNADVINATLEAFSKTESQHTASLGPQDLPGWQAGMQEIDNRAEQLARTYERNPNDPKINPGLVE